LIILGESEHATPGGTVEAEKTVTRINFANLIGLFKPVHKPFWRSCRLTP
jgi:hypothetical protein